jgi:hypothetical protein
MKLTRRQLNQIINEAMYDPLHSLRALAPNKSDGEELTPEEEIRLMQYNKIMSQISDPETSEKDLKHFHTLSDTITGYKDPRPGMPDDSFVGVREQQRMFGTTINVDVRYLPAGAALKYSNLKTVEEEVEIPTDLVDELVESHAEYKTKGGWPKDVIAATKKIILHIEAHIRENARLYYADYQHARNAPLTIINYHPGATGHKSGEYNEAMDFMKKFGWFKGKI